MVPGQDRPSIWFKPCRLQRERPRREERMGQGTQMLPQGFCSSDACQTDLLVDGLEAGRAFSTKKSINMSSEQTTKTVLSRLSGPDLQWSVSYSVCRFLRHTQRSTLSFWQNPLANIGSSESKLDGDEWSSNSHWSLGTENFNSHDMNLLVVREVLSKPLTILLNQFWWWVSVLM